VAHTRGSTRDRKKKTEKSGREENATFLSGKPIRQTVGTGSGGKLNPSLSLADCHRAEAKQVERREKVRSTSSSQRPEVFDEKRKWEIGTSKLRGSQRGVRFKGHAKKPSQEGRHKSRKLAN